MAIEVKFWVGTDGKILKPQSSSTYNTVNLISDQGVVYFPITQTVNTLEGQPMGLLLAITYAA